MQDSKRKVNTLCAIAFLAGCLLWLTGCAWGTVTRMNVDQHQYETGAAIYIDR